ncbi:chemotaxis protein CheB [Lysobacter sp. TY2-98]|uniref:chemotaxis protein CheB n=1 Tax=Lysobacter sp. TY2-98 TaxID=2290922 RepID=UPI0013B43D32|nr:chemotaxis protein CheB [Lysobacter sp. TY2-98]
MSDTSRRVALLARPGAARDSVRGALLEIGADIVAEEDPGASSPDAIRSVSPDVLMIVLDPVSEGALDRYDSMLGDPSIEVMFEEADVAASRDGWEAARWRRHLAAKLHHRQDVLPPVAGADLVPAVDPLTVQLEEMISTDDPEFPPVAQIAVPEGATGGEDFSVFDPAAADADEMSVEEYVLSVHGLELDPSAIDAPLPETAGIELEAVGFDGASLDAPNFEGVQLEGVGFDGGSIEATRFEGLPPVTGPDFSASDFDPLLAELDAELPDLSLPDAPALPESDWQGGLVDDFAVVEEVSFDDVQAETASPTAAVPPPLPPMGFGELSLADDAAPIATAPTGALRSHDLGELERRIASLELVDDTKATSSGAVLVLAGIGGPDAVRQLLGALPARFSKPVLIRQRLDGARYDKLVAQLQRAAALPVALAQAGDPIQNGQIYVLGDDMGVSEDATAFATGGLATLVARIPAEKSAVLVFSGADAEMADAIADLGKRGAFIGAQSADGCYDATAASAVAARGAVTAPPSELAAQLAGRWSR